MSFESNPACVEMISNRAHYGPSQVNALGCLHMHMNTDICIALSSFLCNSVLNRMLLAEHKPHA